MTRDNPSGHGPTLGKADDAPCRAACGAAPQPRQAPQVGRSAACDGPAAQRRRLSRELVVTLGELLGNDLAHHLTFRLLDMALLLLFGGDPQITVSPGFTGLRA